MLLPISMIGHTSVYSSISEPVYKGERAKEKFNRISRFYGLINIFGKKPNREGIRNADIQKGERILEIGMGIGSSLKEMAFLSNRIYGIDSSYGMVRFARDRVEGVGISCAKGEALPFRNRSFDLIFCSGLFDLLTEDMALKILKEIKRVLKPEGRLLTINMTKKGDEILRFTSILYEWLYSHIFKILGDYRPLSRPIDFIPILKRAGFSIEWIKITTILFFPFPVEIILGVASGLPTR